MRGTEKYLAKSWGRLLGVYPKKIAFDGHFPAFLTAKARAAIPEVVDYLLESLKAQLHRVESQADDAAAYRAALPEGLRKIIDLPVDDFEHPELFMHDQEEPCGNPDDPEAVDEAQHLVEVNRIEDIVARLEALQQPLLDVLARLRDEVSAGLRPETDPLAQLTEWRVGWSALPDETVTLADARALIEAASAEALVLSADEALISRVLNVRFDVHSQPEALAVIDGVRESVAEMSPPLDDSAREALEALLRVLMARWPDAADSETVQNSYDLQVLAAALTLTPDPVFRISDEEIVESESEVAAPPEDDDDLPERGVDHDVTELGLVADPGEQSPVREVLTQAPHVDDAEPGEPPPSDPEISTVAAISSLDEAAVPEVDTPALDDQIELDESGQPDPVTSTDDDAAATEKPPAPPPAQEVAAPAQAKDSSTGFRGREPHQESVTASALDASDAVDYLNLFDQAAASGDFALAYWFAVGGRDEIRARVARMLVLGTSGGLEGGTSQHPRANALAALLGSDLAEASPEVSEMVAAALVPAALLLPPYSDATLSLNQASSRLGNDCPDFVHAANTLTYVRGSGLHTLEAPALLAIRDRARGELSEFVARAPSRTIRFHRATEVWRELIRHQGLLGGMAAQALARPDDPGVRQALTRLEERGVDRIIRDTDQQLNPAQAKRQAIIAGAKQELVASIQRYLDAIRAYLDAEESVRAIDNGSAHTNTELIEALISSLPADPVDSGLSAVGAGVARWLHNRLTSSVAAAPVAEADALDRPLAKAYELMRGIDRDFDHHQVTVDLVASQAERSVDEAFNGYLAHHDYVGLEVLLDAVRSSDPAALPRLEERERRGRAESREALQRAVEATRVTLLRALAGTSLSEAESQEHLDKLERVVRDPNPHYREALAALAGIQAELEARQRARLDNARLQLEALPDINESSRERIDALIAAGDLLSAEEFLAQLSNGATSLPEEDTQDPTLEEFWPAVSMAATQSPSPSWFSDRLREGKVAGFPLPHSSALPRIRDGLVAWDRMAREGRRQGFEGLARDVLGALGFQQIKLGPRFSAGKGTSENVFEARYDGYALIPSFGSQAAGSYGLFLCWERKTVDGLLQAVRTGPLKLRPTVVLYFQTLKPAERRVLAEESRRKGLPHIVVDSAAMAYLGTREEARLDTVMHVCLPFAGSNPYTPFALGDVPREVFYGRREELHSVQDPNGPLFVYGGRQLGKSALLKTAMSEFGRSDENHVSIYLDLKAEGVGEWRKADDLWRVLVPSLQAKGVISSKLSNKLSNPESIVTHIAAWLTADERRRLLLLLDESDAFLDEDSRPRDGGKGQFKNVYLLKNLMNQSARRFKPVFAGLHQVQRFHKESNGPMAHVGTEIPIGPLPPSEAFKLVVRPLEAIGYRFVSPDVVWRLLSHTNYQASLIQLFCKELVNDLKSRKLGMQEPPTLIDAHTVDRVYENKELRGQIAQRFDWTIQLDNRYRVIAFVAAWLNLAHEVAVAPIVELRTQCADFWPVGFDGVSPDEFRALLDEMVGLGILVRNKQDQYGIRSPNVIRLLGSKDEIERKLMESSSLELPTVFDPTRYRRKLSDQLRSPVTEAQAARMLANASVPTVVTATGALGADRFATALIEIAASGEGVQVFPISMTELNNTLTQLARMRVARHVLLDARGADPAALAGALQKLARQTEASNTLTSTVLIEPSQRSLLDVTEVGGRDLTLERWSDAELHAVEPEADVPLSSETRLQLLDLTGGWPDVLDPVLASGRQNGVAGMIEFATQQAQRVVDGGWDSLARHVGIDPGSREEQVLESLLEWDEPINRDDLADLLSWWSPQQLTASLEMLVASGVVHVVQGSSPEVPGVAYRANPLVARTMKAGR